MGAATETEVAPARLDEDPDEPALAHYGRDGSRTVALCGARLIGVTAPPGHPICPECLVIRAAHR